MGKPHLSVAGAKLAHIYDTRIIFYRSERGMQGFDKKGLLGLPVVNVAQLLHYRTSPFTNVLGWFRNAAATHPLGQQIGTSLQADKRFVEMSKHLLNTGNGGSPIKLHDFVSWYLYRANEVGTPQASKELNSFLDSDTILLDQALWLYGVSAKDRFSIADKIDFVPLTHMPESQEKDDFHQASISNHTYSMPPPRVALVKRIAVPKTFSPSTNLDAHKAITFTTQTELEEIATVLNCVAGVSCMPGCSAIYFAASTPPGPFLAGGWGAPILDMLPLRQSHIAADQAKIISELAARFSSLSPVAKTRFSAALHRLGQAKGRLDAGEKSLDLGIALEMLLLNEKHDGAELPGQLNLHFRIRGAWLIGNDAERRQEIYKTLGKIYSLRSKIAHNGYSNQLMKMSPKDRDALLAKHTALTEEIVRTLILKGEPKNWAALTLGG